VQIHPEVFIHELAYLNGSVNIGKGSSIWPYSVLRADLSEIIIGRFCNIQDHSVIHCDPGFPARLGNYVTVGHGCVIHGCTIGNNTLIGMHSTILNGAVIGDNCLVAAHSLILPDTVVPDNTMMAGVPAAAREKAVNPDRNQMTCRSYYVLGQIYKQKLDHELPDIFPEKLAELKLEDE
jgi:carbonic anhydrase/acetyltransferase-like protein (isoleucine patch superfamily)